MQDEPFEGAISTIRKAIGQIESDLFGYDHIYLLIDDQGVRVTLSCWPERDRTSQSEDDRLAAVRRFEREMYDDTNKSVWLEIFPCSIEVGYHDVTGREVTISKEYERIPREAETDKLESITECA